MRKFEMTIGASTEDGHKYDLSIELTKSAKAMDVLSALHLMTKRVEQATKNALSEKIKEGDSKKKIASIGLKLTASDIQKFMSGQ